MTARLLALLAVAAVALAGAPPAEVADAAAKKAKRVPACKTEKASKKAAAQRKGKRRCRPRARHLRRPPAIKPPSGVTPEVPTGTPALPLAGPDPGAAAPAQPTAPADPTCAPSRHLGATAEDADGFRLRLTRTCVPAGEVTVNWQNTDASEHDLWARPLAGTGGTVQQIIAATLTTELPVFADVTLTPGRWELFCSLAGHGAMRAAVTVTP